jgi:hypothetical protein
MFAQGQGQPTLESGGLLVSLIGLAALLLKYAFAELAARRDASLKTRELAIELAARDAEIARLREHLNLRTSLCPHSTCPFPHPDGSARCAGSDTPRPLT